MLSRCCLDFSVSVGAFVIGLSQISSFFSKPLSYCEFCCHTNFASYDGYVWFSNCVLCVVIPVSYSRNEYAPMVVRLEYCPCWKFHESLNEKKSLAAHDEKA